jgi:hypothetical protein
MSITNKKKRWAVKRDDPNGAIVLIPHYVLNSHAYKTLSGSAVRLLIDITMQYNNLNNGALLASFRYMNEKRGWASKGTLNKALIELQERHLIVKTVQGRMPNRASWFAIGWCALDDIKNLDIKTQEFPRGKYAHWKPSNENGLPQGIISRKVA